MPPTPQPSITRSWRRLRNWLPTAAGSLKLRITLAGIGALVVGIGLTTALLVHRAEQDTLHAYRERELADTVRTADAISRRVVDLQRALQAAALRLDPETLADPVKLSDYIDDQAVLRGLFSNVFVASTDGKMRIYADRAGVRTPDVDLSTRSYFQRTLVEQRPIVSEPLPGRVSGQPVVVFSVPLRLLGQVYGVLAGSLDLSSREVLGDVGDAADAGHPAQAGALTVVADLQGRVLSHPSAQALLRPLASEPRLAQAFAEWQAGGSAIEPAGFSLDQPAELVSAGGVVAAEWMVWRTLPREQLLAPLHAARRQSLQWAGALIAVMSGAILLLLHWLLRPLTQLQRRAERLFDGTLHPLAGWPRTGGELGRLARALRKVLAERSQLEAANALTLRQLSSVMRAAPVGIAFTRGQRFELASAEFCRLFGHAEQELVGRSTDIIFASPGDGLAAGVVMAQAFLESQPYVGEWTMRRADGSCFPARLRARPVVGGNDADTHAGAEGTIWTLVDIGEQLAARAQVEWSASHDGLTGLANRGVLEQRLANVFTARPKSVPVSVVMLDLDHFKPINDSAGHAAGDAMLRAVAAAIAGCVRAGDLVCRLGGDEFALLLERCAPDVALRIAESVQVAIAAIELPWQHRTLRVGASLGVAPLTAHTRDPAAWLAAADAACYRAKSAGRGRVRAAARPVAERVEAAG